LTDPLDIIFSPAQVARAGTAYIEARASNKTEGIPFYLPAVDDKFLPLLPGELCTIIGRPGAGKSALAMYWARARAKWLQVNQILDRVVVYITYEQHVEELYAFHVAAEVGVPVDLMARGKLDENQMELVRDYGVRRAAVPLWFMGHSQERRKKRPRIDLTNIVDSLARIENWEVQNKRDLKVDIMFVDYLQRIPFEGRVESKTIGVDDNLNKLKDMGLMFSCPVVCGVQARREVDDRDPAVPELNDGQWTSAIEQVSDKVMSVVRPVKYKDEGEMFGKTIVMGRNQMLICLLKQKMGDAPFTFWTTFDPQYNRMIESEEINYTSRNLNNPADWSDV
jgi:replicative DNA helicase